MNRKRVYIVHPVGGDVELNSTKITEIVAQLHREEKVIPMAPYLISLLYLDDDVHDEKRLGIELNLHYFHNQLFDEVWLYGDKISSGMREEIILAWKLSIPVKPKTEATRLALIELQNKIEKTPIIGVVFQKELPLDQNKSAKSA